MLSVQSAYELHAAIGKLDELVTLVDDARRRLHIKVAFCDLHIAEFTRV